MFDVNTVGRLRRLSQAPGYVEDFGPHTLIMDVTAGGGNLSLWDVRIFEQVDGDQFRLHHERIPELGVPLTMIHEALVADFELLEATDPDGGRATDDSNRVYFAYRHRGANGSDHGA